MLKNIPPILSPELLKVLAEMGHSDRICIGDGNFPGARMAKAKNAIFLRADGHGVPELLDAILKLIPLDTHVEKPVALMEVSPGDTCPTPEIWTTYKEILAKHEPNNCQIDMTERFAFYERAKKAYLIIATGEMAIYANVLLKKGVVKPE